MYPMKNSGLSAYLNRYPISLSILLSEKSVLKNPLLFVY